MRFCKIEVSRGERSGAGNGCRRVVVCLMGMVLLAGAAWAGQQGRQSGTDEAQKAPEANHQADASGQAGGQQAAKQNAALSREERNRQIVEDSAKLLKLVTDLKIAVDNTTMDTLSIGVIRKADEIEKLAKNTREKVKQSQDSASSKK